ncbi:MAG: MBL fold metallo-hydrolase [Eubacteriaceae bacterium]|nr:MBL fold metallo-hydrolase [Eubacteriaceae bacterium]
MKISFYGAAETVTGSCFLLEAAGKRILVDCGLFQGGAALRSLNAPDFAFSPESIDIMILTHAHIDHSGRIPKLVRDGYKGPIYATEPTVRLCSIMLRDSAHIQESDAAEETKKALRKGLPPILPLYTQEDAIRAMENFRQVSYNDAAEPLDGIRFIFRDAGHMLGSSIVEVFAMEDGKEEKIVFSGDLGNSGQPLMNEPAQIGSADYVVCESTYGSRAHPRFEGHSEELLQIALRTLNRGGTLVIPAFAVGRTQEILYELNYYKENGMLGKHQNVRVFLDSPLAIEATEIFKSSLFYLDREARDLAASGDDPFVFENLEYSLTTEDSKRINGDSSPKIIISASGMADAGRVRHHIKHAIYSRKNAILFVGYQAEGTLGRYLLSGAKDVKMFGERLSVQAEIASINTLSAHADKAAILLWLSAIKGKKAVALVHGEEEALASLRASLRASGESAFTAKLMASVDLSSHEFGEGPVLSASDSYRSKLAEMASSIAQKLSSPAKADAQENLDSVKLYLEAISESLEL